MRISDWSSDVCSSDLGAADLEHHRPPVVAPGTMDLRHRCRRQWFGVEPRERLFGRLTQRLFHRGAQGIEGQGGRLAVELLEFGDPRSEEHTSELQSLMRISYAVFCLKKKKTQNKTHNP